MPPPLSLWVYKQGRKLKRFERRVLWIDRRTKSIWFTKEQKCVTKPQKIYTIIAGDLLDEPLHSAPEAVMYHGFHFITSADRRIVICTVVESHRELLFTIFSDLDDGPADEDDDGHTCTQTDATGEVRATEEVSLAKEKEKGDEGQDGEEQHHDQAAAAAPAEESSAETGGALGIDALGGHFGQASRTVGRFLGKGVAAVGSAVAKGLARASSARAEDFRDHPNYSSKDAEVDSRAGVKPPSTAATGSATLPSPRSSDAYFCTGVLYISVWEAVWEDWVPTANEVYVEISPVSEAVIARGDASRHPSELTTLCRTAAVPTNATDNSVVATFDGSVQGSAMRERHRSDYLQLWISSCDTHLRFALFAVPLAAGTAQPLALLPPPLSTSQRISSHGLELSPIGVGFLPISRVMVSSLDVPTVCRVRGAKSVPENIGDYSDAVLSMSFKWEAKHTSPSIYQWWSNWTTNSQVSAPPWAPLVPTIPASMSPWISSMSTISITSRHRDSFLLNSDQDGLSEARQSLVNTLVGQWTNSSKEKDNQSDDQISVVSGASVVSRRRYRDREDDCDLENSSGLDFGGGNCDDNPHDKSFASQGSATRLWAQRHYSFAADAYDVAARFNAFDVYTRPEWLARIARLRACVDSSPNYVAATFDRIDTSKLQRRFSRLLKVFGYTMKSFRNSLRETERLLFAGKVVQWGDSLFGRDTGAPHVQRVAMVTTSYLMLCTVPKQQTSPFSVLYVIPLCAIQALVEKRGPQSGGEIGITVVHSASHDSLLSTETVDTHVELMGALFNGIHAHRQTASHKGHPMCSNFGLPPTLPRIMWVPDVRQALFLSSSLGDDTSFISLRKHTARTASAALHLDEILGSGVTPRANVRRSEVPYNATVEDHLSLAFVSKVQLDLTLEGDTIILLSLSVIHYDRTLRAKSRRSILLVTDKHIYLLRDDNNFNFHKSHFRKLAVRALQGIVWDRDDPEMILIQGRVKCAGVYVPYDVCIGTADRERVTDIIRNAYWQAWPDYPSSERELLPRDGAHLERDIASMHTEAKHSKPDAISDDRTYLAAPVKTDTTQDFARRVHTLIQEIKEATNNVEKERTSVSLRMKASDSLRQLIDRFNRLESLTDDSSSLLSQIVSSAPTVGSIAGTTHLRAALESAEILLKDLEFEGSAETLILSALNSSSTPLETLTSRWQQLERSAARDHTGMRSLKNRLISRYDEAVRKARLSAQVEHICESIAQGEDGLDGFLSFASSIIRQFSVIGAGKLAVQAKTDVICALLRRHATACGAIAVNQLEFSIARLMRSVNSHPSTKTTSIIPAESALCTRAYRLLRVFRAAMSAHSEAKLTRCLSDLELLLEQRLPSDAARKLQDSVTWGRAAILELKAASALRLELFAAGVLAKEDVSKPGKGKITVITVPKSISARTCDRALRRCRTLPGLTEEVSVLDAVVHASRLEEARELVQRLAPLVAVRDIDAVEALCTQLTPYNELACVVRAARASLRLSQDRFRIMRAVFKASDIAALDDVIDMYEPANLLKPYVSLAKHVRAAAIKKRGLIAQHDDLDDSVKLPEIINRFNASLHLRSQHLDKSSVEMGLPDSMVPLSVLANTSNRISELMFLLLDSLRQAISREDRVSGLLLCLILLHSGVSDGVLASVQAHLRSHAIAAAADPEFAVAVSVLNSLFIMMDADGSGSLSTDELTTFLSHFGVPGHQTRTVMRCLGSGNDTKFIRFSTFCDMVRCPEALVQSNFQLSEHVAILEVAGALKNAAMARVIPVMIAFFLSANMDTGRVGMKAAANALELLGLQPTKARVRAVCYKSSGRLIPSLESTGASVKSPGIDVLAFVSSTSRVMEIVYPPGSLSASDEKAINLVIDSVAGVGEVAASAEQLATVLDRLGLDQWVDAAAELISISDYTGAGTVGRAEICKIVLALRGDTVLLVRECAGEMSRIESKLIDLLVSTFWEDHESDSYILTEDVLSALFELPPSFAYALLRHALENYALGTPLRRSQVIRALYLVGRQVANRVTEGDSVYPYTQMGCQGIHVVLFDAIGRAEQMRRGLLAAGIVGRVLDSINISIPAVTTFTLLAAYDLDGSGHVTLQDFMKILCNTARHSQRTKMPSLEELHAAFDAYDFDFTGTLQTREVRLALLRFGFDFSHVESEHAMQLFSANATLTREGFVSMLISLSVASIAENERNVPALLHAAVSVRNVTEQRIRSAFNLVDVDGSGEVSAEEACDALRERGFAATVEEIGALLADYGGSISWPEFFSAVISDLYGKQHKIGGVPTTLGEIVHALMPPLDDLGVPRSFSDLCDPEMREGGELRERGLQSQEMSSEAEEISTPPLSSYDPDVNVFDGGRNVIPLEAVESAFADVFEDAPFSQAAEALRSLLQRAARCSENTDGLPRSSTIWWCDLAGLTELLSFMNAYHAIFCDVLHLSPLPCAPHAEKDDRCEMTPLIAFLQPIVDNIYARLHEDRLNVTHDVASSECVPLSESDNLCGTSHFGYTDCFLQNLRPLIPVLQELVPSQVYQVGRQSASNSGFSVANVLDRLYLCSLMQHSLLVGHDEERLEGDSCSAGPHVPCVLCTKALRGLHSDAEPPPVRCNILFIIVTLAMEVSFASLHSDASFNLVSLALNRSVTSELTKWRSITAASFQLAQETQDQMMDCQHGALRRAAVTVLLGALASRLSFVTELIPSTLFSSVGPEGAVMDNLRGCSVWPSICLTSTRYYAQIREIVSRTVRCAHVHISRHGAANGCDVFGEPRLTHLLAVDLVNALALILTHGIMCKSCTSCASGVSHSGIAWILLDSVDDPILRPDLHAALWDTWSCLPDGSHSLQHRSASVRMWAAAEMFRAFVLHGVVAGCLPETLRVLSTVKCSGNSGKRTAERLMDFFRCCDRCDIVSIGSEPLLEAALLTTIADILHPLCRLPWRKLPCGVSPLRLAVFCDAAVHSGDVHQFGSLISS